MERSAVRLARNARGFFEIRFSVRKSPDQPWRSRTVSTRKKTAAEAEAFLSDWLITAEQKMAREGQFTVEDMVRLYMREKPGADQPAQHWSLAPVLAFVGDKTAGEITPTVLQAYIDARCQTVKVSTVKRELTALKAAVNYAVRTKRCDPAHAPIFPTLPDGKPRQVFLTEPEIDDLLTELSKGMKLRLHLFASIAYYTAARPGAIEDLTWNRVDLRARVIDFRNPYKDENRKRRARVPISDKILPLLEAWRAVVPRADQLVVGPGMAKAFRSWASKTERWKGVTAYVFRHSYASNRLQAGVPLWKVAKIMGDRPETVDRSYGHFSPGDLRDAV